VIHWFKENGKTVKCGYEIFYNMSDENPFQFSVFMQMSLHTLNIMQFGQDGMLLYESTAPSSMGGEF